MNKIYEVAKNRQNIVLKTVLTNVGGFFVLFFHWLTLGNWLSAYQMDCLLWPDPDLSYSREGRNGLLEHGRKPPLWRHSVHSNAAAG